MEQAQTIDALFDRAKVHRVSMAAICKRAEIAPTTPSRWKRNKNGANLGSVIRLHDALSQILAESAAERATA
jgi:hypothetical protein